MVRIGTPINKPTPPRSIVTDFSPLSYPFLSSPFISLLVLLHSFSFSSVRCSTTSKGKPINHRIPSVYCGTRLAATSSALTLVGIPRVVEIFLSFSTPLYPLFSHSNCHPLFLSLFRSEITHSRLRGYVLVKGAKLQSTEKKINRTESAFVAGFFYVLEKKRSKSLARQPIKLKITLTRL